MELGGPIMQTVKEIMTKNPACCRPETSLVEVAKLMRDHDCGEIPVCEQDKPVGVVTDRDIVCRAIAQGKDATSSTARECMSSPVVTLRPDTSVEDAVRTLEDSKIRRGLVVDERGRLIGIVAQADFATKSEEACTAELVKEVSRH